MKRVVVTGIGAISSLGIGRSEIEDSLRKNQVNLIKEKYLIDNKEWGEFYLHKIPRFDINNFDLPQENFNFIKSLRNIKKEDIDLYYFLAVIKLALSDSRLSYNFAHNEIGLLLTHENPGVEIFFEELIDVIYDRIMLNAKKGMNKLELTKLIYSNECEERGYNLQTFSYLFSVAKVFDFHGYSLFINNACASGIFAIDSAARQIRSGVSPVVIVAAIDNPTKIYKYLWFKKHGLYAEDGITRPFSKEKSGIVFGDGGAALVLEDIDHALSRGADIYGEYLGGGFSLEGWKITVPDITNDFYLRSFQKALKAANVKAEDINFVNPHGVGMRITDTYEAKTVDRIFGSHKPLVSAFKPLVGHNLGGSAVLESAITLLAIKNNFIPATLNSESIDEKLNLNIVTKNIYTELNIAAKMSCGFAGFNGVAIFSKVKK